MSEKVFDSGSREDKKHNAALICLARRRCDVILAMLRDQQTYLTPDQRAERADATRAA